MAETTNNKNYEDIFIKIIEYIRDNPNSQYNAIENYIIEKYRLNSNEDSIFVATTINKVSISGSTTNNKIINPDALFYLMEFRELTHSLKEAKEAKAQAKISTDLAEKSIKISIRTLRWSIALTVLTLIISTILSLCEIKSGPDDLIGTTNTELESIRIEQKRQNEALIQYLKKIPAK